LTEIKEDAQLEDRILVQDWEMGFAPHLLYLLENGNRVFGVKGLVLPNCYIAYA